ncbi:AfsA-related hotdog domain-containing protein [Micromonospora sp. M12]
MTWPTRGPLGRLSRHHDELAGRPDDATPDGWRAGPTRHPSPDPPAEIGISHAAGPRRHPAERFTLAGDMPYDHPLFNDGLGQVHDSLLFVEIVRHVGAFISRRYFRVPLDRRCRFDSVEFALSTPAAWRVSKSPAHMAVDLHASPAR